VRLEERLSEKREEGDLGERMEEGEDKRCEEIKREGEIHNTSMDSEVTGGRREERRRRGREERISFQLGDFNLLIIYYFKNDRFQLTDGEEIRIDFFR